MTPRAEPSSCAAAEKESSGFFPLAFAPLSAETVAGAAALEAAVPDGWSERCIADTLCFSAARCFVALGGPGAADARPSGVRAEVCGFAAFSFVIDEANLDSLSVGAACRRRGVATALLQHAFCALQAEGAQRIFLEVRSRNASARALYASLGFTQVGLRRGFYRNPADDAVIMEKTL